MRLAFALTVVSLAACADSTIGSAMPSAPAAPPAPSQATGAWLTLQDTEHGFAVRYPGAYVVLPEPGTPPGGAVHRVRLQERELAASAGAALEPPKLTLDVFELGDARSLPEWLAAHGRLPSGASREAVSAPGAAEGLRIRLRVQLAPNEFVYFRGARFVYALTPLGPDGPSMIESFRVLP
jgi:hypothetical protein